MQTNEQVQIRDTNYKVLKAETSTDLETNGLPEVAQRLRVAKATRRLTLIQGNGIYTAFEHDNGEYTNIQRTN